MTVTEGPVGDTGLRGARTRGAAVVVVRSALGPYRALIQEAPPDAPGAEGHLRVAWDQGGADGRNRRAAAAGWARACADVLYGVGGPEHAARALRRYPGCLLATARDADSGRCVAVARGGDGARCVAVAHGGAYDGAGAQGGAPGAVTVAVAAAGGGPVSGREHALMTSLLHAWLEAGLPLEALATALWTFPWPGRREPSGGAWDPPGARLVRVALSPLAPKAVW